MAPPEDEDDPSLERLGAKRLRSGTIVIAPQEALFLTPDEALSCANALLEMVAGGSR